MKFTQIVLLAAVATVVIALALLVVNKKRKETVKLCLQQAVEVYRVVRSSGS
jgi:hypothetical protein